MNSIILFVYFATALAILVPGPSGPYSVALKTLPLTDPSRIDPYASPETQRRILLSAFLPVPDLEARKICDKKTLPYMSPAVAKAYGKQAAEAGLPNTTFQMFDLEFCKLKKQCKTTEHNRHSFPLIPFSPGLGISRELFGARARSLASHGYAVVTIDHPYDAIVVEFPDGTTIPGADIDDSNTTQVEAALNVSGLLPISILHLLMRSKVRRQDISFALSELQTPKTRHLLTNYPHSIDFAKVAATGHSLGGATAAAAAAADPRILGGLNMDGEIFNPVLANGLSKPFVQVGGPGHQDQDESWDEFWRHLRGPAMELALAGTMHGSFPDTLTLLSALNLPEPVREALRQEYGEIDPMDMDTDLNGILTAFLEFLFTADGTALADFHENFPDVTVVRSKLV
ncbi:hypothetical protein K4F52_006180 [Lecanicillium sp. MT-2017a]|nr:hypothetical protein K4F52_006180 [Lecanicillium sp. MT-2017a]